MTKTRVLAALIMAPLAIGGVLLLPTPWLMPIVAALFLTGLWEWLKLADIEDHLARTVLLACNLALMVALVWGTRTAQGGSLALLELVVVLGVVWWLLSMLWLKHYDFASDHVGHARVFKLLAGTLAVVPAWCALVWIHASEPNGHRWLLTALAIVWAADSGAYFVGRTLGKRKLAPRISPNKTIEGLVGGVACGLLNNLDIPYKAVLTTALAGLALGVIGYYFSTQLQPHEKLARYGLASIAGGAIGNLIDRVRQGYVLDFVDVYWGDWHFWAFNVADSAITIGAIMVFADLLLVKRHVPDTV